MPDIEGESAGRPTMPDPPGRLARRRRFLTGAGAAVAAGLGAKLLWDHQERFWSAEVFIARADSYEADLERPLLEGLAEIGFDRARVGGKCVLLKPNLVEPSRDAPHINTHPLVVRAAAEVFRRLGAREVLIGEGQGHCRDSLLVLEQSGLEPVLAQSRLEFIDLNHDDVDSWPNRLGLTPLAPLHLPRTLRRADILVSMPKLKTHHWAGITLSMKNLFGLMPGICYGWPKNPLHHAGIDESILDINATVRPHLAIVDGIIGMEGDGPIMGTPRHAGVVILGTNLPAVDATGARVMGLAPQRIGYLAQASGRLGPISEARIAQRGESIARVAQTFRLLDHPLFGGLQG